MGTGEGHGGREGGKERGEGREGGRERDKINVGGNLLYRTSLLNTCIRHCIMCVHSHCWYTAMDAANTTACSCLPITIGGQAEYSSQEIENL